MKTFLVALSLAFASAAAAQQPAPKDDPAPQTPEQAQQQRQISQPGNNAPVWREVQRGEPNFTSIPGRETNVLIQPPARFLGQEHRSTAGEAWRQFRNGPMTFYGGWLVVLVLVAILAFYFTFGPVKLHDRPTGRLMQRFSRLDQIVHWSVAISFCILGLTGLLMFFGKHVLLPVIGYTLFGLLTNLGKNLHNFVAPLFMVSVAAMIVLYVRHNLPKLYDIKFLLGAFAVMAQGKHIPSGKFNGGEKVWFWGGVVVLSIVVSWTGVILLRSSGRAFLARDFVQKRVGMVRCERALRSTPLPAFLRAVIDEHGENRRDADCQQTELEVGHEVRRRAPPGYAALRRCRRRPRAIH